MNFYYNIIINNSGVYNYLDYFYEDSDFNFGFYLMEKKKNGKQVLFF